MAEINKGGRPKIVIDYDMVKLLAGFNCTQEEIAIAITISNPPSMLINYLASLGL